MATGLDNGVYDTTKITPPPGPNYSNQFYNGSDLVVELTTAGTWDGHQVVGILFNNSTTYHSLTTISLADGLLGSTATDIKIALPGGDVFYLVTDDNYGIPFTVGDSDATQTPLSGANIAVGPNRRRKYLLGYI